MEEEARKKSIKIAEFLNSCKQNAEKISFHFDMN
jgi:hypothetical protein